MIARVNIRETLRRAALVIGVAAACTGVLGSTQASAATEQAGQPAVHALETGCGTDSMNWGSTPALLN
jgi:hypothetical protein